MDKKEYTIETVEQIPLDSCFNKYVAIIKCIFNRKAKYVFEFDVNENDEYELVGCVFKKGK